jgi:uncharacterized membrane protein (DUF373 family)
MKTTIKKIMQVTMLCAMVFAATVITKKTVKSIRQLYNVEKYSNTTANCFFDMIN